MIGALGLLPACTSSGQSAAASSSPPVASVAAPASPANGVPGGAANAGRRGAAAAGPITPGNPSTAIVDINRSTPAVLGVNSPPPSSFENSCAPAPYLFQSRAGYEAVRVKDCRNDQLVYLPTAARAQVDIYVAECQRRCGIR